MPAFEAGRSLTGGEHVVLSGTAAAHHVADVLRARAGDRITLFHAGELYDGLIERVARAEVSVFIEAARPSPFYQRPLTLLQAVIRPALLDDVIRLCSPLGVQRFVLFPAMRSQPWKISSRLERLEELAGSSAEQAETGEVPGVELTNGLGSALARVDSLGTLIALSPRAERTLTGLAQQGSSLFNGSVGIAVGPEGGFTDSEAAMLTERGALSARLATGILRSELAGFAGALLVREIQAAP
ncbi:MAG: RsmE family RNA methyltransferase [Candidatus Cryosericum sp.]